MVIHRSRCGEPRRRPAPYRQGACGKHPLGGELRQGTTCARKAVASGTCPSLPGRRSQRRLPRAPPRPRPVPLLNHLSLATRGRTTPEDRAAGWHAPCRNKQSLPAFGHSSRPPPECQVSHTQPGARGWPGPFKPSETQTRHAAFCKTAPTSSCPPRLGREPQTFFFTFLVSVRDPPHPAYPGPTRRHLVRSQAPGSEALPAFL